MFSWSSHSPSAVMIQICLLATLPASSNGQQFQESKVSTGAASSPVTNPIIDWRIDTGG